MRMTLFFSFFLSLFIINMICTSVYIWETEYYSADDSSYSWYCNTPSSACIVKIMLNFYLTICYV